MLSEKALHEQVRQLFADYCIAWRKWMLSSFGVGAIYIKRKYLRDAENFKPPFFSQSGQKNRENFDNNMNLNMSDSATRFELGTPNLPNIVALNAALKYISKIGIGNIEKRILNLTDYLIHTLWRTNDS